MNKKQKKIKGKEYDFIKFYMEHMNVEMRHTETLRYQTTYFILFVTSIITGLIAHNNFSASSEILAWLLMGIGIIGVAMSRKLYMLHQFEQERNNHWYRLLRTESVEFDRIFECRDRADIITKQRFYIFSRIRHNWFWLLLNALPVFIGAGFLLKIYNVF